MNDVEATIGFTKWPTVGGKSSLEEHTTWLYLAICPNKSLGRPLTDVRRGICPECPYPEMNTPVTAAVEPADAEIKYQAPTGESVCVNDDIAADAGSGLTTPLFSRDKDITPFTGLVLPTGQVQDEGLFTVDLSIPDLSAFIADTLPNGSQLDGIRGTPLGEAAINGLVGRTVCAKVHDSDVSDLGEGKLNATGAYMGLTAFTVTATTTNPAGGSYLPLITVDLLPSADVQTLCESVIPQ